VSLSPLGIAPQLLKPQEDTLTDEQLEILFRAWELAHQNKGQVVKDWAIPDAHELCEAGWLERRFQDGELSWWWSDRADLALDLAALSRSDAADWN
jgi:hypothetical protein